jgi:hypothetical protein
MAESADVSGLLYPRPVVQLTEPKAVLRVSKCYTPCVTQVDAWVLKACFPASPGHWQNLGLITVI